MNHDKEDAIPTMPKWPFFIGDFLLVSLAVITAILNDWKLSGVQLFAGILSIALGATLLVIPYITEYLMFAKEELEYRANEVLALKRNLEELKTTLLKQNEQLKALEANLTIKADKSKKIIKETGLLKRAIQEKQAPSQITLRIT